jgi:hypothetical protein
VLDVIPIPGSREYHSLDPLYILCHVSLHIWIKEETSNRGLFQRSPDTSPESALSGAIEALAARFGNSLITSQAVREQHAHTTTWLPMQPPDAVVMAQNTEDVQDVVRICAKHGVPVIPFGTGTSLEGQVNAPAGASVSTCAK